MNNDKLRRTVDDLVELVGGYNPRGMLILGLSGFTLGFLLGGFLAMRFGIFFLLFPPVAGLVAGGVVAYTRFQRSGGLSNVRRPREPAPSGEVSSEPLEPIQAPPQSSAPVPDQLSELERRVVELAVQANGNVSVSALANELGVSADSARQTIEDLIGRGVITLG